MIASYHGAQQPVSILRRVAAALLGLPAPRRRRMTLTPTPVGIIVRLDPTPSDTAADGSRFLGTEPDHPGAYAPAQIDRPAAVLALASPEIRPDRASERWPDCPADDPAHDPNRAARSRQAALIVRPPADHAAALLRRLQDDPATVGALDYEVVSGVYADMLIEMAWAPVTWGKVSQELRALTGGRKRYRNGVAAKGEASKVLVFDIPLPGAPLPIAVAA